MSSSISSMTSRYWWCHRSDLRGMNLRNMWSTRTDFVVDHQMIKKCYNSNKIMSRPIVRATILCLFQEIVYFVLKIGFILAFLLLKI